LRSTKYCFLSLLYPLPWSNGFFVGSSKRGGPRKTARAHVRKFECKFVFLIYPLQFLEFGDV
jgi:hypothetical protein